MNNALMSSFWESGWFGKSILLILFALSIFAWGVLVMKWRFIKDIKSESNKFFKLINNTSGDMLSVFRKGLAPSISPFQNVYHTLADELTIVLEKTSEDGKGKRVTNSQLDNLSDLANCTISDQVLEMEKYLPVLATTASISPLLGLLGTVWGVLISFRGISVLGSASISAVAPGISEALVTTVAGLIVAIPALIGYNWVANKIRTTERELENFTTRMLSRIQLTYTNQSYEKETAY